MVEDFLMNFRNAKYNEFGTIDCEVEHPKYGWIPFTASPHDTVQQGVDIFEQAKDVAEEYTPPPQEVLDAIAEEEVRSQRNILLKEVVDPVVSNTLRWASMSAEEQQAWADYRQALLDVPQQAGFPHNVTWPTKPSA
jgi:hypothetical protein